MTEPVAYWHIPQIENEEIFVDFNPSENSNFEDIPLYTSEDLHPRMKMTKKQYNRLMWDKENTDLFQCLDYFHEHDGNSKFGALTEDLRGDLTPEDIARAWLDDETIEIVPDMKWFVRSKKRDDEGDFEFISGIETPDAWGYSKNHNGVNDPRACAYAFDTKEEAELWLNPLTEAVLLPVGDE
ncbi:hypothetical protein [Leuconostoc gasicomitatum]|uniref:hypothetical protein n=1 Tax=Leuconostoc gasicomitatum TaxID=115778 RepID=UPI001CC751AC|nr:hypothetical protein [Leuconostoc gasicomitatum]MBZ5980055.1 hypothetical protein [Leuconostoc gasicomitatum]